MKGGDRLIERAERRRPELCARMKAWEGLNHWPLSGTTTVRRLSMTRPSSAALARGGASMQKALMTVHKATNEAADNFASKYTNKAALG